MSMLRVHGAQYVDIFKILRHIVTVMSMVSSTSRGRFGTRDNNLWFPRDSEFQTSQLYPGLRFDLVCSGITIGRSLRTGECLEIDSSPATRGGEKKREQKHHCGDLAHRPKLSRFGTRFLCAAPKGRLQRGLRALHATGSK